MFRLVVLVFALTALAVAHASQVSPVVPMLHGRITGGETTEIENVPYQVSIQINEEHICGGSIISPTRVLTTATCAAEFPNNTADTVTVKAGSSYHNSLDGTIISVESICSHPLHNNLNPIDNDVSVLKLSSALPINKKIQPISIVTPGTFIEPCLLATVSGWGATSETDTLTEKLKKVDVPKVSQEKCREIYGKELITDSMTCYGGGLDGKGFCKGDSGSPLAVGRIQVGIASWTIGCAEKPQVYVDLTKAIIRNHINSCG